MTATKDAVTTRAVLLTQRVYQNSAQVAINTETAKKTRIYKMPLIMSPTTMAKPTICSVTPWLAY